MLRVLGETLTGTDRPEAADAKSIMQAQNVVMKGELTLLVIIFASYTI
jgi:hypothetical protein